MDKNAIKKYAVWARREMIDRVRQKAAQYGITDSEIIPADAISIDGVLLPPVVVEQRKALIQQLNTKGYREVMEEVAYTWFNRFIALRFMEVNGYLPSRVRVFTDAENGFHPQILAEAIDLELDGLDMEKVYALKNANEEEALYKYLLITQCNALNPILPVMFQKIEDYTELLLPDNLLREGSVIEQMVTTIPEEDWTDQVQIIGWLYQYYNAEKKDKVFAALKKNVKITKENIPAATQLFTPDWIVRYMVENSLGRLWIERNAGNAIDEYDERPGDQNEYLLHNWKYYVFEAKQSSEVEKELSEKRKALAGLAPEQIKCIDPCCGSGHILVYMFDVLMRIYQSYGYTPREAARSIVAHNLYGLDIDERAAQLSYFAVMMKARQYDRQFLRYRDEDGNLHVFQPNVYAICESNDISRGALKYFGWSMSDMERNLALEQINDLLDTMQDAKEYGSIITVPDYDWGLLYRFVGTVDYSGQLDFDAGNLEETKEKLWRLLEVAATLAQKYDVVVTNPPYMGVSNASAKVQEYIKKEYPDSKSDFFAVFIEQCGKMLSPNRYQAMVTQHAWMFLSSFEKLRTKLLSTVDIVNMAHLGARAFEEIGGEVVQTTSFVIRKSHVADYKGEYCRLIDPTTQQGKEDMFLAGENRYEADQSNFSKIPGSPVAYWVKKRTFELFSGKKASEYYNARVGLMTTDNDRFLRFFWEVSSNHICYNAHNDEEAAKSQARWFPHNKGGSYRKWAGNRDYIVDWENNGFRIKETAIKKYPYLKGNPNFVVHDDGFYFHENISWSEIAMGNLAFRYYPNGFTFNVKGMSAFQISDVSLISLLAFANSKVANFLSNIVNPSISFGVNSFGNLPFLKGTEKCERMAEKNISISEIDWDSYETSWNFKRNPLAAGNSLLTVYATWKQECEARFQQLKKNEEELNRIFIDIYGLQDELTPEVVDKDITVHRVYDGKDDVPESMRGSNYVRTMRDEIVSLISYAVGCMFGRYSLNADGLVYAGGNWDDVYRRNRLGNGSGDTITVSGVRIALNKNYTQVNINGEWENCTFPVDRDNIIPISDDEYFDDDIVGRFVEFVKTVYGEDTLDENLKFIADALGGKGAPKEVIRNYFLNDFYADHCKIYQKRPIYWLFDSGKKNGFKALIYMHRYREDTIARIRTDYVHEQQGRYRTAIADLESRIANADTGSRVKLTKQLTKLRDQAEELRVYEEKIHHLADQMIQIDLDDGVKHNYEIFKDVLAKIK